MRGAAELKRGRQTRTSSFLICAAGLAIALSANAGTVAAVPPIASETCVGDRNDDGVVSVDELIRGIGIALGEGVDFCAMFDANRSGLVDVADVVAAVSDSLHGCGERHRADLSGFEQFRFERRPALGFCPPLNEVFTASIRRAGTGFAFEASTVGEGQLGVDDCLPGVFFPEEACLVVHSEPARMLREDEIARVSDAFSRVVVRDSPRSECRGCSIDPCLINTVEWDGVRTTDYDCAEVNRIDGRQTRSIVDLLEDLRQEAAR